MAEISSITLPDGETYTFKDPSARTIIENSITIPMWRNKKALIIGDSWCAGWNGSETVTGWTSRFISMTGVNATVIKQPSGGFMTAGNSTSTYPNENFTQVLEHVKNNSYDLIVVQDGVNDIINTTANIDTALTNFKSACDTYWPGVPIFLNITTPCYYLVGDYFSRARSLINMSISRGFYVNSDTTLLSLSGPEYKGTDRVHLNVDGYKMLGSMIAGFVTGQKIDVVASPVSYPTYTYPLSTFAINTSNATSSDYYVRCFRQTISVYMIAAIKSTASSGFITIASGLPMSTVAYESIGPAVNRTNHTAVPVPIYINDDSLVIQNLTNASLQNKELLLSGTYTTRSM